MLLILFWLGVELHTRHTQPIHGLPPVIADKPRATRPRPWKTEWG